MSGLNIDDIIDASMKKELYKVIKEISGSDNVEVSIEPGSKKGK